MKPLIVAFLFSMIPSMTLAQEGKSDLIICPAVIREVCALKSGKQVTYKNDCEANKDGAIVVANGACKDTE